MDPIDDFPAVLGAWSVGRGPLYLLLAARFREVIDDGFLPAGTPLPTDRALAAALSVGRSTVVAAYDLLRHEGRIVRRQGSGTRVAETVLSGERRSDAFATPMFLHLLESPDDLLLLSCAAPDDPPPELAEAYGRISPAAGDLGYHPAGHPALRTALADRYSAQGLPTGPEQILVTTGAQQALSLLIRLLVEPGDSVLVEAPTYPGALDALRQAGAVLRPVATGPDGIDVHAAAEAMTRYRPAMAYVIPDYHNPTGAVLPAPQRRRLARAAAETGVRIVDDQVLTGLSFDPAGAAAAAGLEEAVKVGSLSKAVWGGLRIGWLRAPASTVRSLARLKAVHDLGTDVPAQLVAADLLPRLDTLLRRRGATLRERHDHLRAELAARLPSWHCPAVSGGQTLWVRLPRGDGASFAQTAVRHGVAVLPGGVLDATGAGTAYLRIPFLLDPPALSEAVRRLAAAWRAYHGAGAAGEGPAALGAVVV